LGHPQDTASGAFPKIQILTVEGPLNESERAVYPDLACGGLSFKKAQAEEVEGKQQPLR
jgi:hypothetical protein